MAVQHNNVRWSAAIACLCTALILLCACGEGWATGTPNAPTTPSGNEGLTPSLVRESGSSGRFVTWGYYQLEIARDGSDFRIVPDRTATAVWGYHLNAVKLLEASPCTNCLSVGNIHLLPDGDLSIDVSITHPFSNPAYTGFDVRGVILFPASQYIPDNELRLKAGLDPTSVDSTFRYSSMAKGDAELVNPDGWTMIWAPDFPDNFYFEVENGFPIFDYYPGKFASGDNLGTINAYRHFYTNDNRHMFEAGKTVTRTYVIHPPAQGPIEASYSIYAHWAEPLVMPVTDPAADFGPEANSPMPYEFSVTQDSVIDPDAPEEVMGSHLHWHVKSWAIGYEKWGLTQWDILLDDNAGGDPVPYPGGGPDEYRVDSFRCYGYCQLSNGQAGQWPYVFKVEVFDPNKPWAHLIGADWYITKIDIGPIDGDW